MVLKPGANSNSKVLLDTTSEFLEREYAGLKRLLERAGTRYQLAEAFLLLKAMCSDAIQEALATHDAASYEDIMPVIRYEMQERVRGRRTAGLVVEMLDSFVKSGEIPAQLLEAYATVVKSNVEIKLLMALFGYRPVPYPGSDDGTGALPVSALARGKPKGTKEATASGHRSAGEAFLIDNFDKCSILVLKDAHWSAIKTLVVEDGTVWAMYFLDPGITSNREFHLDPWDARARLYLFTRDAVLEASMARLVHAMLSSKEHGTEGHAGSVPE